MEQDDEAIINNSSPLLSYKELRKARNPDRKRHGARNQHKVKHFVRFLLETFPDQLKNNKNNTDDDDDCSSQSQQHHHRRYHRHHVLDVAGGKGELAARLCVCHQQKVVMVDPRPSDPLKCFETSVFPKVSTVQ